jgi:hypothetical protein
MGTAHVNDGGRCRKVWINLRADCVARASAKPWVQTPVLPRKKRGPERGQEVSHLQGKGALPVSPAQGPFLHPVPPSQNQNIQAKRFPNYKAHKWWRGGCSLGTPLLVPPQIVAENGVHFIKSYGGGGVPMPEEKLQRSSKYSSL